jgi:hypothetical protein
LSSVKSSLKWIMSPLGVASIGTKMGPSQPVGFPAAAGRYSRGPYMLLLLVGRRPPYRGGVLSGDGVPPDVAAFIAKYVGSVVQLESLLLLAADAARVWTADEVARELRIEPAWAEAQLEVLCGQALLACTGGQMRQFRYSPSDTPTRETVSALSKAYAERRVTVISLIFAKPPDGARAFADAFRIRKDGEGRRG